MISKRFFTGILIMIFLFSTDLIAQKKKGTDSFHLYNNEFDAGDGREVALIFSFKTWSDLDIDDPFKNHFEAMYGKDSWKTFLEDWNSSIDGINQVLTKVVD